MYNKEVRFITFEEAKGLLNDDEYIHTFRQAGTMLLGADHNKDGLLATMKQYESTLQIGGDACRGMKHGLILEDTAGYLFIETNEIKLNIFDPIIQNHD